LLNKEVVGPLCRATARRYDSPQTFLETVDDGFADREARIAS
jgi:hypothetical protein